MRIRLSEPDLVPELVALLRTRIDCITAVQGLEIEASLVGSYADGGARKLTAIVEEWRQRHPEIEVELL